MRELNFGFMRWVGRFRLLETAKLLFEGLRVSGIISGRIAGGVWTAENM